MQPRSRNFLTAMCIEYGYRYMNARSTRFDKIKHFRNVSLDAIASVPDFLGAKAFDTSSYILPSSNLCDFADQCQQTHAWPLNRGFGTIGIIIVRHFWQR